MTARELKIDKAVLDYLHSIDRGQDTEIGIHFRVIERWPVNDPRPSAAELAESLIRLDAGKFITGVTSRFGKQKWNISDAGEAARLEM
jgi:hypothetical protein